MELDFEALRKTFMVEASESLRRAEEALLALERQPGDSEALAEIFRIVHTLKGDAGALGFEALAQFSHKLEDLLDLVRGGAIQINDTIITFLLQAGDGLQGLLDEGEQAEFSPTLVALLDHLAVEVEAQQAAERAAGTAEPSEVQGPESASVVLARDRAAQTLRVDLDRLDQLLTLTGEITVSRGRLTQLLEDPHTSREELIEEHREADRLNLDVQDLVMKLRMVPVGPSFQRFQRTVRDLAASSGKSAQITVLGGDVEIDSSVLRMLQDPLTHMVRNAMDHGVELPEVRQAAGKEPTALITLSAAHDAGSLVLELSDDGAGIDREKVLAQGRARGLIDEQADPTDAEIYALILEPGFSTADEVTELSGRGVGMDVVRRNIENLRGTVEIHSEPGQGTCIAARLPLTLAIIEGLMVQVGEETYVVPLDSVIETVDFPRTVRQETRGRGVFSLRDRTLPYVRLSALFQEPDLELERDNMIVVRQGSSEAGLVVNTVLGKTQTVIKPLTKLFLGLNGFSGSTIIGSGRVALILDVPGILRQVAGELAELVQASR